MAEKKLSFNITAEDDASRVFQKLSQTAKREMGKVDESFDDTRSAGKRAADALSALFDELDADLAGTKEAADRLATALGPELAAKVDTTVLVGEFRKLGLSIDDVKADADSLAAAVKKADDVTLRNFTGEADRASRAVGSDGGLTDSARGANSALANMIGNSAQDLGAVTGLAGSAGVAIGQMAEYASDATLGGERLGASLLSMAKVAGPIAAVAAGIALVKGHFDAVAATNAFNRERVDKFRDALDDATLSAEELAEALGGDDGNGIFVRVADSTKNVEQNVANLFGTFQEFERQVRKGAEGFDQFEASAIAANQSLRPDQMLLFKQALDDASDGTLRNSIALGTLDQGAQDYILTAVALGAAISGIGTATEDAAFRQQFYGTATEQAAEATENHAGAMGVSTAALLAGKEATAESTTATDAQKEALDRATKQFDRQKQSTDRAREALEQHRAELLAGVGQTFDYETAQLQLTTGVRAFDTAVQEGETSAEELRLQEIQLAEQALATAEAFAAEQIAAGNTASEVDLQKFALIGLQNQFPGLRDEIQRYIDKLNAIPAEKNTAVNLRITGLAAVQAAQRAAGIPVAEARGTNYGPAGAILVGEEGPEIVQLPQGHRTIPANETASILANSGGGGGGTALVGGGGGDTYIINMPPGTDGRDLTRQLERYKKYNGPGR